MQAEDILRERAAHCHSAIAGIADNLPGLYAHYGLPADGTGYARRVVTDAIRQRIRDTLRADEGWTRADLKRLERHLILRHVVDDAPLEPHFRILTLVIDAVRSEKHIAPLDEASSAWGDAIQAAYDHLLLDPSAYEFAGPGLHNRTWNVGRAARSLRKRGSPAQVVNGEVALTGPQLAANARRIRAAIRAYGALAAIERVFAHIAKLFDPAMGRYHITRSVSQMPGLRDATPPLGYILNLCVRELSARGAPAPRASEPESVWKEILDLSTALVATYDVEPYSIYESMFHDTTTLLPFLQKLAVFDSAFTLQQMRPSDVARFLRGMFDWVDDPQFTTRNGWSIADAISVAEAAAAIARNVRGPTILEKTQLASAVPGVGERQLTAILGMYTHPVKGANSRYELPTDVALQDFGFKPLLPWSPGQFLMLDASWCAPAFFEAIATAVRADKKGTDDAIGTAAERFVEAQLSRHGVRTMRGDYDVNGEHGECDAVIETTRNVVFLEMKKKVLTRAARSGSDVELLVDLSKSLFAAQAQAGWHELRLRTKGALELSSGGTSASIRLGPRGVERVAVSLLDYGALQDRIVLSQVLTILMGAKLATTDPALQGRLDALATSQDEFAQQYPALAALDPGRKNQPFFNCWFLSVPQILVLLDEVTDAEGFERALWSTRHVTHGSGDFYFELAKARERRAAVPA